MFTQKHRGGTERRKIRRMGAGHGPAAALTDLPQLRRVWSRREWAEKNSSLVHEVGKCVATIFGA